ncbi:hypothetical protein TARUN_9744 [Trichoderma arundinaceum]|uniref:Uncharacterized protein n=1 Tax=Trichoderma arundinaceum TaxID=490622 RepID=A0A395N9P5_TRIAR|nr:hypothetical protein TARUN_9744 [Trichoderma arundinaceum]
MGHAGAAAVLPTWSRLRGSMTQTSTEYRGHPPVDSVAPCWPQEMPAIPARLVVTRYVVYNAVHNAGSSGLRGIEAKAGCSVVAAGRRRPMRPRPAGASYCVLQASRPYALQLSWVSTRPHCLSATSAASTAALGNPRCPGLPRGGPGSWLAVENKRREKLVEHPGCVLRPARGRAHEVGGVQQAPSIAPKTGSPAGAGGAERPAEPAPHTVFHEVPRLSTLAQGTATVDTFWLPRSRSLKPWAKVLPRPRTFELLRSLPWHRSRIIRPKLPFPFAQVTPRAGASEAPASRIQALSEGNMHIYIIGGQHDAGYHITRSNHQQGRAQCQ